MANRVKVTISLDPEFWKEWQEYAEHVGLSGSGAFEFMGRALLRIYRGDRDIYEMIYGARKDEPRRKKK